MKKGFKINAVLLLTYSLLAFPLFYFVYKYSSPYVGMVDFFDYYKLYKNMDYHSADSPLNMRLLSTFCVYCLNKSGLSYETMTQIDNAPFDKSIYFNAILFNYICVVVTCVVIFQVIRHQKNTLLYSFTGGVIYLLGFGTIFFELMPLADALGILLFSMAIYYYNKRDNMIYLPLILLILQREYLLLAFGLIFLIDYAKYRNNYYLFALIGAVICFGIYVFLRKTIFETERYSHHTNFHFMKDSLTMIRFPLLPFIRQTVMTMNVLVLYVAVIIYKICRGLAFNKDNLIKTSLLFIQILLLTFLLALGNNAGRYYYMLTPLIIMYLIEEIRVFSLEESGQ